MDRDSFSKRMKGYERPYEFIVVPRSPVIVRLDGKAFHNLTKFLDRPFDVDFHNTMVQTTHALMREMQNAVFAYTQSDEISILLNTWKTLKTETWFGNRIQKIASVSSSIATAAFNYNLNYGNPNLRSKVNQPWAIFDSRVFALPINEVQNYFIWRQNDAVRNSINALGQHHFSHKKLMNKNTGAVIEMLMNEKKINWHELDSWKRRGSCFVMTLDEKKDRSKITLVEETPNFRSFNNAFEVALATEE